MEKVTDRIIEWGVASQPLGGQPKSGDMHFVKVLPQEALVVVIDGLGHGEEAAAAAAIAVATLERWAGEPLMALVAQCHQALRDTRGAVMGLASFHPLDSTGTWLGVGNVEGFLWHPNVPPVSGVESLLVQGGLVGDRLPALRATLFPVTKGDVLIFATDGVHPDFAHHLAPAEDPRQMAEQILTRYNRGTDDALVLVARYVYEKEYIPAG